MGKALDASKATALKELFPHKGAPVFSSEVAFEPGLLDKLSRIEQLGIPDDDPLLPSLISVEELWEFTHQTGIPWFKHTKGLFITDRGTADSDQVAKEGILRGIMDQVKGIKQVGKPVMHEIHVPIAEIHCPKVQGCRTTFTLTSKDTSDYAFKVTILGFGGGAGRSISFGRTASIPAEGKCLKYHVPVTTKVTPYVKDGIPFSRADIVKIKDGHRVSVIPENEDHCRKLAEAMKLSSLCYEYEVEGTFTGEVEIDAGKKLDWEWGLSIPLSRAIGTELTFRGSIESLKTITYSYELVGKHRYIGYEAPGSLGYCWDWKPV